MFHWKSFKVTLKLKEASDTVMNTFLCLLGQLLCVMELQVPQYEFFDQPCG
jgi:hypothetical protein